MKSPNRLRTTGKTCDQTVGKIPISGRPPSPSIARAGHGSRGLSRVIDSSSRSTRPIRGSAKRVPCVEARANVSQRLTSRQAENVRAGAYHAARIGLPLNRFITIDWELAGVDNFVPTTGRFLKLAGDWLRKHDSHLAYVWVREAGDTIGNHVHILLHVPPQMVRRSAQLQRGWLRACGAKLAKRVIKTRPIGAAYRLAVTGPPEVYVFELRKAVSYLLKQGRDRTNPFDRRGRRGSMVTGKRCSTSENIGRAARARFAP